MANILASETAKTAMIIAAILLIPVAVFMYANNSTNNSRVESEQDQIADIDDANIDTDDSILENGESDELGSESNTDTSKNTDSNGVQTFPNTSSKVELMVGINDTKQSLIEKACGEDFLSVNLAINNFSIIPGRTVMVECN